MVDDGSSLSGSGGRLAWTRLAMVVAAAALIVFAWRVGLFDLTDLTKLRAAINRAQSVPNVALWFVIVYAIGSAIGVPVTPLTLAGGALFGARLGIPLNWVGAMLGAILSFGVLRATSALPVPKRLEVRLSALGGARGAMLLFQMRLVPVAPFALLNVAAAALRMRWRGFVAATAFGVLPSNIIYTSASAGIVAGLEGGERRAFLVALLVAAGLITFSIALPRLARRMKLPSG